MSSDAERRPSQPPPAKDCHRRDRAKAPAFTPGGSELPRVLMHSRTREQAGALPFHTSHLAPGRSRNPGHKVREAGEWTRKHWCRRASESGAILEILDGT